MQLREKEIIKSSMRINMKYLYASIDMLGMSNYHTAEEGDGFCVPEKNMFGSEMCKSIPE